MLTLIGMFIFLAAEFIFDSAACGNSTNWSIFYFASTYLSMVLIATDLLFKESSKSIKYTSISFGLFFIILIVMELSFINVPFDKYIVGVNENKIKMLTFGLLATVLIFITVTAWVKRLSKR